MRPTAARFWKRLGLGGLLLIAVLAVALALRLKGVGWGLPYSFVNADESVVVPKGFAVARGHLNPEFFYYPSLFFYLLGIVYLVAAPVLWLLRHANPLAMGTYVLDPGPYFLLGRLVSVACGTASVYLVYRLGRVAFGRPAGLLAALFLAVAPLHVAYSHMAVTDVTASALSLLALLLLVEAARGRGRRWLLAGAVAAGLATSTKYNLGMLILPATVAAAYVYRGEVARRVAAGGRAALLWPRLVVARVYVPMLLAFVAASPFIVLDAPSFVHDFLLQNRIMARGWLGFEHAGNGFWYNLNVNLDSTMGVVLLILALAGLAWALWRHTAVDLILAPYVIVYFAYVSTWKELADRYLLPVLPLLLLLAARLVAHAFARALDHPSAAPHSGEPASAAGGKTRRTPPLTRWAVVGAAALFIAAACALPLADSVRFDGALRGTDVRVRAMAWVDRHVPAGSTVASENYGPPLVHMFDEKYFVGTGRRAYHLLPLALPQPGVSNISHTLGWLRENRVQYAILSSKVYGRVMAAAADYPGIVAFYHSLGEAGRLIKVFTPGPGECGPVLKVYRLAASRRG